MNARINEKLTEVDFAVITDIRDYFGMTATIIANNPTLRKRMYLDKVDTYAKAHAAVKTDEQATIHSRLTKSADTVEQINAMSSYRRGQNDKSQASQLLNQRQVSNSSQNHYSGSNSTSGNYSNNTNTQSSTPFRGGFSRGQNDRGNFSSRS